tara:strand:- start:1347 stop:1496 length:150 start_codon:yes stop_codon:yes gene_type:complete
MSKTTQTTMRLRQDTLAKLRTLKAENKLSMAKLLALIVDKHWNNRFKSK